MGSLGREEVGVWVDVTFWLRWGLNSEEAIDGEI